MANYNPNVWEYIGTPLIDYLTLNALDLKEFLKQTDGCGDCLEDTLKAFFNDRDVKIAVENNDWEKVLSYWDCHSHNEYKKHGNIVGWMTSFLVRFLAYSDIDFWNYLPNDFNPESYKLSGFIKKKADRR